MSDAVNPTPPAAPAPAAPPTVAAPSPQVTAAPGTPVNVHVHAAPAPVVAPPASQPAAPAPTPAAAPAKPPYVNPYAQPRPAAAAPASPAAAPSQSAAPQAPVAQPAPDPRIAELEATVGGLRSVVAITAQRAVNDLPENLRGYVLANAGDDPAAQIRAIEALRSHGLVPAAPQHVPAGANTAPTAPAPPIAPTVSNPDAAALAQYEALKAKGSTIAASAYLMANQSAIARARAARPS